MSDMISGGAVMGTFLCEWVVDTRQYDEDGAPIIVECGAPATDDDRGWSCANGHSHVYAEYRALEGWDYASDPGEAAQLTKHGPATDTEGKPDMPSKGQLLALLRRFHIEDHHTTVGLESVDLRGNLTQDEFTTLGDILTHPDTPPEPPLDAAAIEAIAENLRQYVQLGVIDYYLPTIPEGMEFVVGFKGQILKLDQDRVVGFLAGCTAVAVAEFMARRVGMVI